MAPRDPKEPDDDPADDTVVDYERPSGPPRPPRDLADETERMAAVPRSMPLGGPSETEPAPASGGERDSLANMPTTVSKRSPHAPGRSEDSDFEHAEVSGPATLEIKTPSAPLAEESPEENTVVDRTASVRVVPAHDVDDVFTSGIGKAVPPQALRPPDDDDDDDDDDDLEPRTERYESDVLRLPARLKDAVQRVDLHLGGYHVHHFLGAGGMATVYLARAPGLDSDVVVKRIRRERMSDRRNVGRFEQEARIALTLQHPNIVRTLDFAEDGGEHFLVMEFLDGYDLRHLAKRLWSAGRPLPLEPILLSLAQAARGLDYAHRKGRTRTGEGVVHRDVSPENLFLTVAGSTKVLDFGLALDFDSERFSATGEVMGKVPYLSPESVRSQPLDGRSDIFALCVTAWWLLTARRPFGRESPLMTLKAILDEDPPPLPKMNPRAPPSLSAILRKGLEKDRRWRYARAADLADALEEAAGEAQLPPDAMYRLVRRADTCAPPPERVTAPFPPTVPWAEWD